MVQGAMIRVRPLPLDPRRVTLLTMLTISGCSGCKPTEQAAAAVVIEGRPTGLMFDASGSMAAALDGIPKTEVAHDSLACLATDTGDTVTAVQYPNPGNSSPASLSQRDFLRDRPWTSPKRPLLILTRS